MLQERTALSDLRRADELVAADKDFAADGH
jgi:hypothetical protein